MDLYVGLFLERRAPEPDDDGFRPLLGRTTECIIADQFLRLKQGDRFFYDLGGQKGSFTLGKRVVYKLVQ